MNLPHVALGAGFAGAVGNKLATVDQKPTTEYKPETPVVSEKKWIKKAFKDVKERGTEGVCTGEKFGGPTCRPGTKRYNMAKTLRKMSKK
jgi:hypothetical protein